VEEPTPDRSGNETDEIGDEETPDQERLSSPLLRG
jgi:hypothetical protein